MTILVHSAAGRGLPNLGDFVTPDAWKLTGGTPIWAADNGCFSGLDVPSFTRMLRIISDTPSAHRPKFVTVPDVVCDHRQTVELWLQWTRRFLELRLPRAFVLQNGAEKVKPERALPWNNLDALFIGGDTKFKLSRYAAECAVVAKHYGKWVHMGRVNSVKRMEHARRIGCDSIDGSGLARFPSQLRLISRAISHQQLYLF